MQRDRRREHVAAGSEPSSQTFRELRGTIDLGSVGLRRDENTAGWGVAVGGQDSTLLGVGQLVCATSDSTLVFSIFDIGVIPRQYNDAQTGDQSGGCDHDDEPDRSGRCFAQDDRAEDHSTDRVDDSQAGDDHLRGPAA